MSIHVTYRRGVPAEDQSEYGQYGDDSAAQATLEVGLPEGFPKSFPKLDASTLNMVKTGLFGYLALMPGPFLLRIAAGYFAWGGLSKILAARQNLGPEAKEEA
jgi:hypothetical protein